MPDKIQIFGKDAWPYTRAARAAFAKEDRQVDYYNVVKDAKNLETMLTYSKGTRKVPVIVEGKTVTIGFEGGTWGVWFFTAGSRFEVRSTKDEWRNTFIIHLSYDNRHSWSSSFDHRSSLFQRGEEAVLDIETAEETHEALKLRVEALERKISELNQAEKTLRRQNNYLTALHETSLGLIDHLDKEIAEILCISKNTVLFHRYNIRQKLDLKNKKINLRSHLLSFDR